MTINTRIHSRAVAIARIFYDPKMFSGKIHNFQIYIILPRRFFRLPGVKKITHKSESGNFDAQICKNLRRKNRIQPAGEKEKSLNFFSFPLHKLNRNYF